MEEFQRQFSLDSVLKLKILHNNLQIAEKISDADRREIFRTLHTIKGTAQTFGLSAASRLAHELENILSAANNFPGNDFQSIFTEGIELLINSFEQENFEFPARFVERVSTAIPQNPPISADDDDFSPEIPKEIFDRLSQTEKKSLESAFSDGKNLYCFSITFDLINFTGGFKNFRDVLSQTGEVIAAFPGGQSNTDGQIGFQILFAASEETALIEKIARTHGAEITLKIAPIIFTDDLPGILSKIVAHGKSLARRLGKKIDFEISAEQVNITAEKSKIVFDILLHLVRNAVDHAFKTATGTIKIDLKDEGGNLYLTFSDNGSGIDLEKVKAKAVEKNLISAGQTLSDEATRNLIFQSEFSTAARITEISGRGIGLDAVKNTVEKIGGKISVESYAGKGTTFEIFLPR